MAATCVRVPVVSGHSESVYIELEKEATVAEIKEVLLNAPGVILQDNPSEQIYPTPLYAEGKRDTFVGRIRKDPDTSKGFHLWIVSDNLLKGLCLELSSNRRDIGGKWDYLVWIYINIENRRIFGEAVNYNGFLFFT